MSKHVLFDITTPGDDGFGKMTRILHQPDKATPEQRKSMVPGVMPGDPEQRGAGWVVSMWVNPTTSEVEWRYNRDPKYRQPVSEFLSRLPQSARLEAREARATDPVIDDFMTLLEMASAEGAGVDLGSSAIQDGLSYLLAQGMLTQEEFDAI